MAVGQGKHNRRAVVRAIIELEGATVKSITTNKSHMKIVCERNGVVATLVTSENEQGKDHKWPAKFRADVRRALNPGGA